MATTLDNQIRLQHDLSHETLMGLQELDRELDPHLALFEPPSRDSSTPNSIPVSTLDGHLHEIEQPSQTIIVDSSSASHPSNFQPESNSVESRARPPETSQYSAGDS
jgi:hypothetical protein